MQRHGVLAALALATLIDSWICGEAPATPPAATGPGHGVQSPEILEVRVSHAVKSTRIVKPHDRPEAPRATPAPPVDRGRNPQDFRGEPRPADPALWLGRRHSRSPS